MLTRFREAAARILSLGVLAVGMAGAGRAWVSLRADLDHALVRYDEAGPILAWTAVRPVDLVVAAVLAPLAVLTVVVLHLSMASWPKAAARAFWVLTSGLCLVLAVTVPGWAGRVPAMLLVPLFLVLILALAPASRAYEDRVALRDVRSRWCESRSEARLAAAIDAAADGYPGPLQSLLDRTESRLSGVEVRTWPMEQQARVLAARGRFGEAADLLDEVKGMIDEDGGQSIPGDPRRAAVRVRIDLHRTTARLTDALATRRTPDPAHVADHAHSLAALPTTEARTPAALYGLTLLLLARTAEVPNKPPDSRGPADLAGPADPGDFADPSSHGGLADLHCLGSLGSLGDLAGRAPAVAVARRGSRGTADPRCRALMDATLVIALTRSGDLRRARRRLRKVPPECPLRAAAGHELALATRPRPRSAPAARPPGGPHLSRPEELV